MNLLLLEQTQYERLVLQNLCSSPRWFPGLPAQHTAPSLTVQQWFLADLSGHFQRCLWSPPWTLLQPVGRSTLRLQLVWNMAKSGRRWTQASALDATSTASLKTLCRVTWPLICLNSQLWWWGCSWFSDRIFLLTWILKLLTSRSQSSVTVTQRSATDMRGSEAPLSGRSLSWHLQQDYIKHWCKNEWISDVSC
jgi:hypothetical protein